MSSFCDEYELPSLLLDELSPPPGELLSPSPNSQRSQPSLPSSSASDDEPLVPLEEGRPTDISLIPEELAAYPGDTVNQSEIMRGIVATSLPDECSEEAFNKTPLTHINLSRLKTLYERKDPGAVDLLSHRHNVQIDDDFQVPLGSGQVLMNTDESMIDYHMTVANCIGFSPLLPNAPSAHRFTFKMDLKKPYFAFKGKHATLGFDPAGCMLFIGQCQNEDVFLAMAPNEFLRGQTRPTPPGRASASPLMSKRHYRQTLTMIAHFLALIPDLSYYNMENVFTVDLDSSNPDFDQFTNALDEQFINLNFEHLQTLDSRLVEGYNRWIEKAPEHWKVDGFLSNRSPIVVTSRFGQNARIAAAGNESHEADAWQLERDHSKLAFLSFALATHIKCTEIKRWDPIPTNTIMRENRGIYDSANPELRRRVRLPDHPLLDDDGKEIPIYNSAGRRISRRCPVIDANSLPCGVLVNLTNIDALFNMYQYQHTGTDHEEFSTSYGLEDSPTVHIKAYPLAYLGSSGNIQADGIPSCFYPSLTEINKSVRKRHADGSFSPEDRNLSEDEDAIAEGDDSYPKPSLQAVKPVSAQLYNYVTHRVATRAGRHDSQQGSVTAAISGGFANSANHRLTALKIQSYCDQRLPSERFHHKISLEHCPTSCRAEFVYSIDVRALKDPSGTSIFKDIILPLARSWNSKDVREAIMEHMTVLKPGVFPALYDWVAYPVSCLIQSLYQTEMKLIKKSMPLCPFRLELLAALERILCFCHTGNTAVLATSLMNPLGLSRGVVKDGFPMLSRVFLRPSIASAMKEGLEIDPRRWPLKNGHPAIASRRAQILTYSLEHFMAYQAKFWINHALNINIGSPRHLSNVDKALFISKIAFDAFFEDTKSLVAQGVRADIAHRKATASSKDLSNVSSHGDKRECCLQSWLKTRFPLSYGNPGDVNFVFDKLLQAVCYDDDLVSYGLPNWSLFTTTHHDFAISLFDMSSLQNPSPPKAPVLRKGSFLPVLKVAHGALINLCDMTNSGPPEVFVKNILKKSLREFKIQFYPAPKPRAGSSGAPNTKPVWNSWGNLGRADMHPVLPTHNLSLQEVPPATIAYNNAIVNDCNAEWAASDLNLITLTSYLRKTSLPNDFTLPTLTNKPYVDDTYSWVRDNYDSKKPLHHLALLVAIITTLSLLPHLFMPIDSKHLFISANEIQVRSIYNHMDWLSKPKKGMTQRSIFISMITTLIIAIYEADSPLRKNMGSARRGGLGEDWTKKHSAKGVTYTLLIRLGVLWGKGTGAYDKGMFGQSWGCLNENQVKTLHLSLCKKLIEKPFGPFDALSLLIGDENARVFCHRDRLNYTSRLPL